MAQETINDLILYNTESRAKEKLVPLNDNHVTMYTCGPTVYYYAHIGNFRTYVFEDLLRRTIQYFGMKITQVMNLTDVDDKTLKGAIAKGLTLLEFTKPYKEAFFEDLKRLNIQPAEHYPAATDYIEAMFPIIEKLLEKGYAYRSADGCIYYAIHKFKRYGCLSHLNMEELQIGGSKRVDADEYDKENASDFVLWKSYDQTRDGNIYWDSPFGPGRPGWHLECSTMAMEILGPSLDIHVGGVDNMFPHHENEIAQSESYSDKIFAKLWMHSEHLLVDNKKMSKSLGNFYTLRDLIDKGYSGMEVRYMLLQTHYRTQLNFTFIGLQAARQSLQRLQDFIHRLQHVREEGIHGDIAPILSHTHIRFKNALADDLNISAAIASVFDLLREGNLLCDANRLGKQEAQDVLNTLKHFNTVLGVLNLSGSQEEIPQELQEALLKRNEARQNKDWTMSDRLRDFIAERGYLIEDTSEGARLKKKGTHES